MKKNKKNTDLFVTNLAAYTSPIVAEVPNKEYVEYGYDNNYFNYLITLYLNSTSNNSIINGICNMIFGRGLNALDADRKPNEYAQMMSLFKTDCLKKFIKDRKMLGMAAFQLVYSKGKIVKVEHFPMETLRAEKCNDEGKIENWYYSSNWQEVDMRTELDKIPAFGFGNQKNGIEVLVLKPNINLPTTSLQFIFSFTLINFTSFLSNTSINSNTSFNFLLNLLIL